MSNRIEVGYRVWFRKEAYQYRGVFQHYEIAVGVTLMLPKQSASVTLGVFHNRTHMSVVNDLPSQATLATLDSILLPFHNKEQLVKDFIECWQSSPTATYNDTL